MAYLTQYSVNVPVIKFNIDQTLMTMGQDIEMDICVPEDGISDNHASVEAIKHGESYRFVVKCCEEKLLFDINGETASISELQDGDWLIIGGVEFKFTDDGVNDIKEVEVPTLVNVEVKKTQSQSTYKPKKSEALTLMKELKQEVESITTKTEKVIEENKFSRRLSLL